MASIYVITNDKNGKQYVGKTLKTVKERFSEHIKDSKRKRYEKRPLYQAFNKYGIEHFSIDILENVFNLYELSSREIYWINKLNTYGSHGYNATLGGDGKILYDYYFIQELIIEGYTSTDISDFLGCCKDVVYLVAKNFNLILRPSHVKIIYQYENGKLLNKFYGANKAKEWLLNNNKTTSNKCDTSVSKCCIGLLNSAFGYVWKYHELEKINTSK